MKNIKELDRFLPRFFDDDERIKKLSIWTNDSLLTEENKFSKKPFICEIEKDEKTTIGTTEKSTASRKMSTLNWKYITEPVFESETNFVDFSNSTTDLKLTNKENNEKLLLTILLSSLISIVSLIGFGLFIYFIYYKTREKVINKNHSQTKANVLKEKEIKENSLNEIKMKEYASFPQNNDFLTQH